MLDPLLTAGVFEAAFGLIVFVVSVLAAFALWRSGTRNPRPWKVLLIVVAVVMAVSSLGAGIAALPRAVEAIDAYVGGEPLETVEQSVVELMYLEYPDLHEVSHPTDMLLVADTVCAVAGDFERPERLLDYLGYVRDELNDTELFAATLAATAAISKAPDSFCAQDRIQRVVLAAQALIDAEGVDAALAAAQVVAGVATTTTRPSPRGIFPGTGAPKLSDAETVWCNTAEGHSATFLAGDALGLLEVAGNGSPHKLTPAQRQALTSVVQTGNTGLTGNQHEEFVEQMRNVSLGWHFARACQAAFLAGETG